jgi:small subunit ribosomal protein S17
MEQTETSKPKRIIVGKVLSNKMEKTLVVEVERTYMHPRLQKVMRSARKYKVHDENQQGKMDDLVEIYEGRPVSKTKYMYLHKVISGR